jgi:hypothetical protein
MSAVNWSDEAVRWSANIVRSRPQRHRGARESGYPGVSVVFGPDVEYERIKRQLDGARIGILGTGHSRVTEGYTFAMLVESADVPMLSELVGAGENS